jgi:perosamine synthetase
MFNTTDYIPAETIPYGCQTLGDEEINAVIEVLKSPNLTQGPMVEKFETAVAAYCGVRYAVAFSSGTAALQAACYAAGIEKDNEAVTSPLTFVATANAVLYQGGRPVFADIDEDTWNLNPELVKAKLSPRTRALILVHYAGQPVDLDVYYEMAEKFNLVVIEDACHALGARYHDWPVGHCRDMAVFSFHPVKSITTGEGGMVVTPHHNFYQRLLQFRSHGITRDTDKFEVLKGDPWEYEMQTLGHNYRITDIQAAIGLVQMGKLDGFIKIRNRLAMRYRQVFSDLPLKMQQSLPETTSACHLFPVWLNPAETSVSRLELFKMLVNARIRPQVHYIPVHLQPYYQKNLGTKRGDCPVAERYYDGCLSLPLYPGLGDQDQEYVISQVRQALISA